MEEFEVMGGGDAVLAALVSAWLGWERLVITVMLGFIFGAVLGGMYLVGEMKKAGILGHCIKRGLIGPCHFFGNRSGHVPEVWRICPTNLSGRHNGWWLSVFSLSLAGSSDLSAAGKRVSRPFPFGPALALAAAVSMFFDPHFIFPSDG